MIAFLGYHGSGCWVAECQIKQQTQFRALGLMQKGARVFGFMARLPTTTTTITTVDIGPRYTVIPRTLGTSDGARFPPSTVPLLSNPKPQIPHRGPRDHAARIPVCPFM